MTCYAVSYKVVKNPAYKMLQAVFEAIFCSRTGGSKPCSEVINLFSCSVQLRMKCLMLTSKKKKYQEIQLCFGSDKSNIYFSCT